MSSFASLHQNGPVAVVNLDSRPNVSVTQPQTYTVTLPTAAEQIKQAAASTPWYVWIFIAIGAYTIWKGR